MALPILLLRSLPRSLPSLSRQTRSIHSSTPLFDFQNLTMPALSPTMTEGSVTTWMKKEGETFVAGEVLLSIETDKASIDVEAQDDGILGKIIVQNNTSGVTVGALIAILAEEGDDLSSIVIPSSSSPPSAAASSPPTPKPSAPSPPPSCPSPTHHATPIHSHPLLPSVLRLLLLNKIYDANKIKATGHKGLLTKGDVLAFLGKISSARGSEPIEKPQKKVEKKVTQLKEMDGLTFRQLITLGLSSPPLAKPSSSCSSGFDDIISSYGRLVPKGGKEGKGGKSGFDEILGI